MTTTARWKATTTLLVLWLPSFITALSVPTVTDTAPSWIELHERTIATTTGVRLHQEAQDRSVGKGPPHTNAALRLFDSATNDEDVRVTFYRDAASWCPYCQKTWLFLEGKRIPYRVRKVPLNAYGDKPAWFTRLVDGGKLPAIELDGEIYMESLEIMALLDETFCSNEHGPKMIPPDGTSGAELYQSLMKIEDELQRAWFSLVFYPVEGHALSDACHKLLDMLQLVDDKLSSRVGPWFLGEDEPSLIDIHYIPTMERLIASSFYYKGLQVRGKFSNLDRWLVAWEDRPNYLASKSDFYTHTLAMPSQNGPGYLVEDAIANADKICGLRGSWELPLPPPLELGPPKQAMNEDDARHEAAFRLVSNPAAVVQFACRGAGERGRPSFHAELADPYAEPSEEFVDAVDICLRHVTVALLDGIDKAADAAVLDLTGKAGSGELRPSWDKYEDDDGRAYYWNEETGDSMWTPPTQQLDTCLAYLRDRVGVPRDMGPAAAMQLRAHLNWAITLMKELSKV
jgi:glutathione S-transferase